MGIDTDGCEKWLSIDDLEKLHSHGFALPIEDGRIPKMLRPSEDRYGRRERE